MALNRIKSSAHPLVLPTMPKLSDFVTGAVAKRAEILGYEAALSVWYTKLQHIIREHVGGELVRLKAELSGTLAT